MANDLLDPGLGGAARGMWREVDRRATDAARALLADHVYQHHGRRAVVFTVDGGGEALSAGDGPDVELPWAYVLEGWSLYAHESGSAVLDLRAATSYATFPTMTSLCAAAKPTLSGAQKAQDAGLTGWTTALPRGTVLRAVLESASTVTFLSLTLYVRAA
jgi:hypothetical protein